MTTGTRDFTASRRRPSDLLGCTLATIAPRTLNVIGTMTRDALCYRTHHSADTTLALYRVRRGRGYAYVVTLAPRADGLTNEDKAVVVDQYGAFRDAEYDYSERRRCCLVLDQAA